MRWRKVKAKVIEATERMSRGKGRPGEFDNDV